MDNMLKDCKTYYGAIDIGSNAVRLLIKCVEEDEQGKVFFSKVLLLRVPLRLGFDVFAMGKISETKEKNMLRLMKVFHHLMKIYDVEDYRACATSAMRDAKNGKDIIKRIKKKTGIRIEIIDGQEEAKMIYNNHIECMEDCNGNKSRRRNRVTQEFLQDAIVEDLKQLFSPLYPDQFPGRRAGGENRPAGPPHS